MSKQFVAILIAIIVGLSAVFWFSSKKTDNTASSNSNAQASNHVEGTSKKDITLVEYGDYECPVCYSYYPTVKEVAAKYSTTVKFQFRNLPLSQLHPNAVAGARAAEAASLQGKFWEMHDMLYENQDPNGQSGWVASRDPLNDYFVGFAKQLDLNVDKFKQDFSGSATNDTINADVAAFNKTGQQQATPTFFLNGQYIDNSKLIDNSGPSLAQFSAVLDAALAAKK